MLPLIVFSFFVIILVLFQKYEVENYRDYYPVACYRDDTSCYASTMRAGPTDYHGPGLLPYRYNLAPLVKGLPATRQPWLPCDRNASSAWLPEWSQRKASKKWSDYRLQMPKYKRYQ